MVPTSIIVREIANGKPCVEAILNVGIFRCCNSASSSDQMCSMSSPVSSSSPDVVSEVVAVLSLAVDCCALGVVEFGTAGGVTAWSGITATDSM